MAEITAAGYTQLRTGTPVHQWFVELRDGSGDPVPLDGGSVTRLSAADSRVTATDDAGTQTLTFAVTLTSGDVGAEPGSPVTIAGSVLYAAATGGSPLTQVEAFDPFVFADPADECVISHRVEVPQQQA